MLAGGEGRRQCAQPGPGADRSRSDPGMRSAPYTGPEPTLGAPKNQHGWVWATARGRALSAYGLESALRHRRGACWQVNSAGSVRRRGCGGQRMPAVSSTAPSGSGLPIPLMRPIYEAAGTFPELDLAIVNGRRQALGGAGDVDHPHNRVGSILASPARLRSYGFYRASLVCARRLDWRQLAAFCFVLCGSVNLGLSFLFVGGQSAPRIAR